ncbi:Tripartite-type tricarboxylate transporter, extracytoplasmic receptor component TctC [Cupriavidus necator]|uniref:Probable extra-cytoplasmic solute receptor n=1 Tax=Cupriavidus necator (strain ATCC 17699 / DSM 428 / KCTC 22496 / NCIMB 10442 / H16 / Stanier 337) TaxID=381666 RepID=Q0KCL5_CUPNH|nr:tripartite tricarboxylate transporter substrate binding protein [Cupriavidus necator]QCC00160.1 tripartite tricarboxylate transporter substrate binding protein [Cupriavidus necator H16]QQB77026.1 tripartite tricarboxylate transporter substrate binding protein [Cupriavidus necator]WKA42013.1 tripartite tricarboxylate transporter substrate binding protein [Cupriavidus necator]CAJ92256.1 probable extra-cytoplasmic solute receptor [Cupriavidus necator H16]
MRFPHRIARALCAALCAPGLLAGVSAPAAAQPWPDKPIRLVVNFPAGGAADTLARGISPGLSEALKRPVVIDNRPGANGIVGGDAVAKAPADGYTFLLTSGGAVAIDPFLYKKMPYDPIKDLTPVASVALVRVYLLVHPSVPAKTLEAFIAYVREHPGRLSYGSAGNGSTPHIAAEMFKRAGKLDAVHVPYKGAAPALSDLLAGQVQFMFDPGPGLQHVASGKLRLLAVASAKRAAQYPDVPTLAEAGLQDVDGDSTFGVYAPAGTPPAIVERMNREINRTLAGAQLQENVNKLGGAVAPLSIQAFAERQNVDRARYGRFIRQAGITVD